MRRFLVSIAALLAASALQPAAALETIRICNEEKAHPPFVYPDRDGTVQILIRMAATRIGARVQIYPAPIRRCRADLLQGIADAVPLAAFGAQLNKPFAFPMRDGRADPAKATATTDMLVFRRKGSTASWDGARFAGLAGPVLIPSAFAFLIQRLDATQVPYDDGARDAEQNFMKMLGGRGDLAILPANDGLEALQDRRWAEKIEVLPAPYLTQEFFLAFAPHYFQARPDIAAALWQAIADVKTSREYRQAISHLR